MYIALELTTTLTAGHFTALQTTMLTVGLIPSSVTHVKHIWLHTKQWRAVSGSSSSCSSQHDSCSLRSTAAAALTAAAATLAAAAAVRQQRTAAAPAALELKC
jgi:hypothetical protein